MEDYMTEIISYCGIKCNECEGYIATQEKDQEKIKLIAEKWSKEYKHDVKPEDVYCNGCLTNTKILGGHCRVCEIRKCGIEKKIENCAHCSEYSCDSLTKFHEMAKDAKIVLDGISSKN